MLITAARVLTAPGSYVRDGAVLTDGETITAVGSRAEVAPRVPAGTPHLDFPEGTIVPGLIDAHVHLAFDGSPDPVAALTASDDSVLFAAMQERAAQLLASGVTTVRDLGDRNGLALRLDREIRSGTTAGPRIVSAAVPVTPPGGHCHFLGGEVSGAEEIRDLVKRNVAAGAGVIKVMETGGGLTKDGAPSWETQFGHEDLAVLVAEAHGVGLPVAAHAHGADGIAAAVRAGVDTLEHCTWMTADGFDLRKDVLEEIIAQGIHVCPTISQHWPMLPKIFGAERAEQMFAIVRQMADAGVKLIAGTDAGVQRTGFTGLADSLAFYEHIGLDRGRVLEMATETAAEALGLGDSAGRIAPGYGADLLVVDGDPLQDLARLKAVTAVIARGTRLAADHG
ncbi:amidohydrolase family protein [Streptomyces sp. NPDC051018]|uniref:amidohydrolase family protein n=1 Tax=Streptomyces sp. NPDC051018 TaxID=3365639 RepID=UPI003788D401